jgi:hypothetical protein
VHEVRVGDWEVDKPWLAELLACIAGPNGYRKRTPFWAYTIFSFARQEQAAEMRLYVGRHREAAARLEAKKRPCPVATRYEEAAFAQYAVIWGLSTGLIRDVVRTYRRERRDCSTYGMPRAAAAEVITKRRADDGRAITQANIASTMSRALSTPGSGAACRATGSSTATEAARTRMLHRMVFPPIDGSPPSL